MRNEQYEQCQYQYIAIVLHASGKQGAQVVKQLLEEKNTFVVCVDTVPSIIAVLEPERTLFIHADITKKKDVEHVIRTTLTKFNSLHIIGNAHNEGTIERLSSGSWNNVIAIGFDDLMWGIQTAGARRKLTIGRQGAVPTPFSRR